jgi:hypothetical protein
MWWSLPAADIIVAPQRPRQKAPQRETGCLRELADVVSEPGFYISRFVKAALK